MFVRDIYNKNISPIREDTTVHEALESLIKNHFNGVLVYDKHDRLAGILCIQDIVAAIVPDEMRQNVNLAEAMYKPGFFKEQCQRVKNKKVKNFMRTEFLKVTPDTTVMALAAEFLNTDLYIFPVMESEDSDKVIGIVTRSELKKALALGMDIAP